MSITNVNRKSLQRTGLGSSAALSFLNKIDEVISKVNSLETAIASLGTGSSGTGTGAFDTYFAKDTDNNLTIKLNEAGTTYIVYNGTTKKISFYIDGTLQGILDATGWSTEPGV